MTKSFWNTSNGRLERSVRTALTASTLDLEGVDAAAADVVLALAVQVDQMMRAQPITLYGDKQFAWHTRAVLSELMKSLGALNLTPAARAAIASNSPTFDPFGEVSDNVRSIMRE